MIPLTVSVYYLLHDGALPDDEVPAPGGVGGEFGLDGGGGEAGLQLLLELLVLHVPASVGWFWGVCVALV